jgi:hypothetical protein
MVVVTSARHRKPFVSKVSTEILIASMSLLLFSMVNPEVESWKPSQTSGPVCVLSPSTSSALTLASCCSFHAVYCAGQIRMIATSKGATPSHIVAVVLEWYFRPIIGRTSATQAAIGPAMLFPQSRENRHDILPRWAIRHDPA